MYDWIVFSNERRYILIELILDEPICSLSGFFIPSSLCDPSQLSLSLMHSDFYMSYCQDGVSTLCNNGGEARGASSGSSLLLPAFPAG